MDLKDKAALVTGASRGLGAALARELAQRGARVVLVARETQALEAVAGEINRAGGQAFALAADVGDKNAIYPLVGAATAVAGAIDVLVHNASTLGATPLRELLDTECEDFSRVLELNLIGPFRLSRAIAGSMALRRTGAIVHVTSDASVEAYPTWGAYSVSKAALDHLARVWAVELGEFGVRSFAVDPGEMRTAMHALAVPGADESELADPTTVAARIVRMLERLETIPNGARIVAQRWEATP